MPITYLANEKFEVDKIRAHDGFFAHVFLKAGETLRVWEYLQRTKPEIVEIPVTWAICDTQDLQREVSYSWRVWRTNENRRLPSSQDELTKAEFGMVMSPLDIVARIEQSAYSMKIPRKGQNGRESLGLRSCKWRNILLRLFLRRRR
jgi:hypothetical protein